MEEMEFEHEERLVIKCVPSVEDAKVKEIFVIASEILLSGYELNYLLYSEKGEYSYCEHRTVKVEIPLDICGVFSYADENPDVKYADGVGEIIVNVKMQTEQPLS